MYYSLSVELRNGADMEWLLLKAALLRTFLYIPCQGHPYAGTQTGTECWCGNQYAKHGLSTSCDMLCPGDNTQTCGGPLALSVYSTGKYTCITYNR